MSIDPVYVHDAYIFNGVSSGQWNWTIKYDNNFFGIPFFNFFGWLYMTGIYAGMISLGRWLYKKYRKESIAVVSIYLLYNGMISLEKGVPFYRTPSKYEGSIHILNDTMMVVVKWSERNGCRKTVFIRY